MLSKGALMTDEKLESTMRCSSWISLLFARGWQINGKRVLRADLTRTLGAD
jgi:hypothetical protein